MVSPREGPDWAPKPPFHCEHEIALAAGSRSCVLSAPARPTPILRVGLFLSRGHYSSSRRRPVGRVQLPEAMRRRRVRSRRQLANEGCAGMTPPTSIRDGVAASLAMAARAGAGFSRETAIPRRETCLCRPAFRRESRRPAPKDGNPAAADHGSIVNKSRRPRHATSPASLGRVR